jgi:uncharacterized protein YjdB
MRAAQLPFPLVVAVVSAAALSGCPAKVATVEVAPAQLTIKSETDTKSFRATAKDADGNELADKPVTWTSSDPAVATVDAQGKVKPAGSGKATITATVETASGSGAVEVSLLKGIKLESPAVVIKVGTPGQPLRVAFTNEKGELIGSDAKIEWKSADPNVATVGPDGAITGVAPGSTTVSAKVEALTADVAVTVNPADPAEAGAEGAVEGAGEAAAAGGTEAPQR